MASVGCRIALGLLAVLLSAFAVGFIVLSCSASSLVEEIAKSQANLEPTDVLTNFVSPPVPVYQRIYMFNLTNVEAVLGGAAPHVEEVGPYVFRIDMVKEMTWRGGLVSFKQYKTYFFEPKLSGNVSLQDIIFTVNPILHYFFHSGLYDTEDPLLRRTSFFNQTVGDLLYNGFDDDFKIEEDNGIPTHEGRAGYLVGKNDTVEGEFGVFSGTEENRDKLNSIITFFGEKHNVYYEKPCNRLEGSNGELYAPFSTAPAFLTLFNPQLCKPWKLHFLDYVTNNDLKVARFVAKDDFLSKTGNTTIDECLELDDEADWQAIFNAAPCQNRMPVLLSLPHFLNGNASLRENVKGLKPDPEKHGVYLDVYPKLGFTVDMRIRVQVNLKLARGPMDQVMPEVIYPIFWQEIMLYPKDSAKAADILYGKVEHPRVLLKSISGGLAALCCTLTVLCIAVGFWQHRKTREVGLTQSYSVQNPISYAHSVNYARDREEVRMSRQ